MKKPTEPKHKHGVVASERGWHCAKTGELLKGQKGLLEAMPKAAKKPKVVDDMPEEKELEETPDELMSEVEETFEDME